MSVLRLVNIFSLVFFLNEHNGFGQVEVSQCPGICECSPNFRSVDCAFRELTDMPEGTFENAAYLYMNDNLLTQLQNRTFNGYIHVIYLSLQRNKIEHIDIESFRKLTLDYLDLGDNQITTISYVKLNVKYVLRFDRNPITMEADTPGPVLTQAAKTVSFTECGLSRISRRFLSVFRGVRYLSLSGNVIEHFAGAFQDLSELNYIDLSQNNISKVEGAGALAVRTSQLDIHLERNPLQNLDLAAINFLQYSYLDISDTPLVCECQHSDVFWWASRTKWITLVDDCAGAAPCEFTTTTLEPTTSPTAGCGSRPTCVYPEFCCEADCSKDGKCQSSSSLEWVIVMIIFASICTVCTVLCTVIGKSHTKQRDFMRLY